MEILKFKRDQYDANNNNINTLHACIKITCIPVDSGSRRLARLAGEELDRVDCQDRGRWGQCDSVPVIYCTYSMIPYQICIF